MHGYSNRKYIVMACAALASVSLFVMPVNAQWSSDPGQNLLVVGGSGDQDQPKLGVTSDGGCYMSWIDFGNPGGYGVRIQYFNAIGEPQFDSAGLLLFSTTLSSSQDWGIAVDADDNAYVAVQYTVSGAVHAGVQKVTLDGNLPWGAGVQASVIDGANMPKVAVTSDGYIVAGWSENGDYLLQKFDADGVAQWTEPYREPHGTTGMYTLSDIHSGGSGSVIVQYVHQTGGFTSPKHIKAQKYAGDASKLWNGGEPVVIMDGYSLGFGYFPGFSPDGSGGAIIAWYDGSIGTRRARVQHLTADGVELLPHDGLVCAIPSDGEIALSASAAYDRDTGDIYMGFTQTNSLQSVYGFYAQRIDSEGTRAWGDLGLELVAPGSQQCSYPRAQWINGAMELFFVPNTSGGPIQGYRLDSAGNQLWATVPLTVSSVNSVKSNKLNAVATRSGMVILAWGDNRNGNTDVYAQNVNPNGELGLPVFLWGDLNHDNSVNLSDLAQLLAHYGQTGMSYDDGDMDGDGDVDISDLAMLLAHYGEGV